MYAQPYMVWYGTSSPSTTSHVPVVTGSSASATTLYVRGGDANILGACKLRDSGAAVEGNTAMPVSSCQRHHPAIGSPSLAPMTGGDMLED